MRVDLQILDNEASAEYKRLTKEKWKINYQLVPPNNNWSNSAEWAIHTFKYHFISVMDGIAPDLPSNLWDLLIPHTEVTLNNIWQAILDPPR